VIDTKGGIINGVDPNDYSQLLTVRGVDAPNHTVNLMQMILAQPDIADHVVGAEWIGGRRWDLITVRGVRIHMPEDDMGYALSRLAKIQSEKDILTQNLKTIDMRAADRIILETPRGQSQDIMNLSSMNRMNAI
jgi:cell division protein FtsQ